jgi:hypothetical protein
MVFGRTRYADPLEWLTTVDADAVPGLDDLDIGDDWLELVVVPASAAIWILRDGDFVSEWAGASR